MNWSEVYRGQRVQKIKIIGTEETRWKILLPTVEELMRLFDGIKSTDEPEIGRGGWGLDGLFIDGWPRSACLNALVCDGNCNPAGCDCGRLSFQDFVELRCFPGLKTVSTIERWWTPWSEAVKDGIAQSALLNSVVTTPYTSLWEDYWQPVGKQYFDKDTIVRRITEPEYAHKRVLIGQDALMDPVVAAKILRDPAVRQSAVRTILDLMSGEQEADIRRLHVVGG